MIVSLKCMCKKTFEIEIPNIKGEESVRLRKRCDACHRGIGIIVTNDEVWLNFNPEVDRKGNLKITNFLKV